MRLSFFAISATTLALLSCQASQSPTSGNAGQQTPVTELQVPLPTVTATDDSGAPVAWVGGWAFGTLELSDTGEQLEAVFTPARIAQAGGDSYLVDVTGFFTQSPCRDCLSVDGIRRGSGWDGAEVRITARHPFAAPNAPTARRDLHVFDVLGVVLSDGTGGEIQSFAPLGTSVRTASPLRNADGLTSLLDNALENWFPTANVEAHPYRVFASSDQEGSWDPGSANGLTDLVTPTGRNIFPMGGSVTIPYEIELLPGATRRVGLALLANYGQSAANRSARTNPIYYLPEYNHKPAWKVSTTISNNVLTAGQTTSTAELTVAVRDWQQQATVASAWEFGTTPKDQIRQGSTVQSVAVAVPGLMAAPLTQTGPGTGTGVFEDMTYTFLLTNLLGAAGGTYPGLVTVTDSLTDSRSSGLDRNLSPQDLGQFTAYQLFFVEVAAVLNDPPVLTCPITILPNPPVVGNAATLSVAAASDPDGPAPLEYLWDFDLLGNATDFNPPDLVTASPTAPFTFPDATARTIGVRARDGLGALSAVCSDTFTPSTGLACADGPQFQIPNTGTFNRVFMHHELSVYGGNPSMGWQQHIALSPVSQDVYLLVSGVEVAQSYGGNYVMRSPDGGCTWGAPILTATRNCPCPPFDGWNATISPYPGTISVTADGHPVLTWMEGICWTRYAYGTNSGANSTTWGAPQTVWVEDWGSYWEWTHQILPDPVNPNRISIVWRGAKQSWEPASYGPDVNGMVRLAFTTNAGVAPSWQTRVMSNVFQGGGGNKWRTYAALGSVATGDQEDVFATWIVNGSSNLWIAKYESTTDTTSVPIIAESTLGVILDPNILVDSGNNPILIFDGAGTGKDIYAKKGVDGSPLTFPSAAVVVNSAFTTGDQTYARAAHDPTTGRTFVAIQDNGSTLPRMQLVTLNSSLAVTETVKINTNDPTDSLYRHVHPQIGWEGPYVYVAWQDQQYTYSSATLVEQFRPAMRILTR